MSSNNTSEIELLMLWLVLMLVAVSSACDQSQSTNCSHVCLALSRFTFSCACPTFGALVLAHDNRTCVRQFHLLVSYCVLTAISS